MTLGIMQPYFFPYLGYFDLINQVNVWIVFDTVQYIRHGWVNRNRILHPIEGWQYIIAPLSAHSRETVIKDIEIKSNSELRARILGQITHYKKRAPFYIETYKLVEECLDIDERGLSRLNTRILTKVCAYLGILFKPALFSEMGLSMGPVEGPGEWALRICEALKANEYLNPPGGKDLFDPAKFFKAGIRLRIQETFDFVYDCPGYKYEPCLSIIDVLMWNSAQKIKAFLDSRIGS